MEPHKRLENKIKTIFRFGKQYQEFVDELKLNSKYNPTKTIQIYLISMHEISNFMEIYNKLKNYFETKTPQSNLSKTIEKYLKNGKEFKKITKPEKFCNINDLFNKLKNGARFYLVNISILEILLIDETKINLTDLIHYFHLKIF